MNLGGEFLTVFIGRCIHEVTTLDVISLKELNFDYTVVCIGFKPFEFK